MFLRTNKSVAVYPGRICGEQGQSSVEAAAVLPVFMLLCALLMQPVCVLYTRMVMRHATAQAIRVMATAGDEEVCRSFVLRRLRAIPEVSVFHVGGVDDWRVSATRTSDERYCEVSVSGHVRPLPLFGVATYALGTTDDMGLLLEVTTRERVRPQWLGGSYENWMEQW